MKPIIWIIDEEWTDYEVEKEMLEKLYPDCSLKYSKYNYQQDLEAFGHTVDVILCQVYTVIPKTCIQKLLNCKGIAIYGGGYDRIDTVAAREMNISVTNVSGYCKEDIADFVMASIYHFNKQIPTFKTIMKQGHWGAQAVRKPIRRIKGSTLLIIGLGRIGKVVAAKGIGLGLNVKAYDPYVDEETMRPLGIEKVSWDKGLGSADFISVNAILNNETQGLLKYEDFQKMKRTAILVNTARGKIILERDLIRAVREKLIAGAVLDVIEIEPPAMSEDVFNCESIVVTPHISYISEDSYMELKQRTIQNAIDMLEGRRPADLVN